MSEPKVSTKTDNGGPAFPRPIGNSGAPDFHDREVSAEAEGMSLRDYFAGQALIASVLKDNETRRQSHADGADDEMKDALSFSEFAAIAYALADAMLVERQKARGVQ